MYFDGMTALAARHLVLAYASIAIIQAGYFAYVAWGWVKLDREQKKSAKPVA